MGALSPGLPWCAAIVRSLSQPPLPRLWLPQPASSRSRETLTPRSVPARFVVVVPPWRHSRRQRGWAGWRTESMDDREGTGQPTSLDSAFIRTAGPGGEDEPKPPTRVRAPTLVSFLASTSAIPITMHYNCSRFRRVSLTPRLQANLGCPLRSRFGLGALPACLLYTKIETNDAPRCDRPSTCTSSTTTAAALCTPCCCSGAGPALVRETRRPFVVILPSAGRSPAWLVWQ